MHGPFHVRTEVPESPGEPGALPCAVWGARRSSPSQTWTRRASVEPDLRQDICVEERVDLVSLLSTVAKWLPPMLPMHLDA